MTHIAIQCPFDPVAIFGIEEQFFDGTFLRLPILPGDYRLLAEGTGSVLSDTYVTEQRIRWSFEAVIRLGYVGYRATVQRLSKLSLSGGELNLITLLDYAYPEDDDIEAAVITTSQPFTQRQGFIRPASIRSNAGKASPFDPSRVHTLDGFNFIFEEFDRR